MPSLSPSPAARVCNWFGRRKHRRRIRQLYVRIASLAAERDRLQTELQGMADLVGQRTLQIDTLVDFLERLQWRARAETAHQKTVAMSYGEAPNNDEHAHERAHLGSTVHAPRAGS